MTVTPSTPDFFTSAVDEIDAIRRIVEILEQCDPAAQDRIAGWVYDRYRWLAGEPEVDHG